MRQIYKTVGPERTTLWIEAAGVCDACGRPGISFIFRRGDYKNEYFDQLLCEECSASGKWMAELVVSGAGVLRVIAAIHMHPKAVPVPYTSTTFAHGRAGLSVFDAATRQLEDEHVQDSTVHAGRGLLANGPSGLRIGADAPKQLDNKQEEEKNGV